MLIFLLVVVSCVVGAIAEGYCPASSTIDIKLNGIYSYPADIFFPRGIQDQQRLQKCPITQDVIELATRRGRKSTPANSFCEFRDYLSNYDETVNVIIFGGSLTVGHGTDGCYCDVSVDSRCNFKDFHPNQEDMRREMWNYNKYCRWSLHFVRGLRSMSLANVKVFNFGQSGADSGYSADAVLSLFSKNNLVPSARDLIFLDHSTNDAVATVDKASGYNELVGLEDLIRNIFRLSNHDSPPNIVLLGQFPEKSRDWGIPPQDYLTTYTSLATTYKLSLWKLRDVAQGLTLRAAGIAQSINQNNSNSNDGSNNNNNNNVESAATAALLSYVPYLRNDHLAGGIHPAWFVHLYRADLYLAVLHSEMAKCFSDPVLLKEPRVTVVNSTAAAALAAGAGEGSGHHLLPSRLSNSTVSYCNSLNPYALNLEASDVISGETVGVIGTALVSPEWPMITEKKGKIGWVSVLTAPAPNSPNFPNSPNSPNTPGQQHQLVFEFSLDALKVANSWKLDIKYMRTYENAGLATVSLCGKPLDIYGIVQLDTLWQDPARFRLSETTARRLNMEIKQYCDSGVNQDPVRSARGVGALVFTHRWVDCVTVDAAQRSRCSARGSAQKVKIISAAVCA